LPSHFKEELKSKKKGQEEEFGLKYIGFEIGFEIIPAKKTN